MTNFETLKEYVGELGFRVVSENPAEELMVIEKSDNGITGMILDIEDPILIIEQLICEVKTGPGLESLRSLLQMNRSLIHGAFALDETGTRVIFRDTIQMQNLDKNAVESSINALSLALAEYSGRLIQISKG